MKYLFICENEPLHSPRDYRILLNAIGDLCIDIRKIDMVKLDSLSRADFVRIEHDVFKDCIKVVSVGKNTPKYLKERGLQDFQTIDDLLMRNSFL